jgi:hypothetical protein
MIREGCVAAVFRRQFRHMTGHAIAFRRMPFGQCRRMAAQTSLAIVSRGLSRLVMRVVTGPAPQPITTLYGAFAQRQLLGMAHYLDPLPSRLRRYIGCVILFQSLARLEISNRLSWIRNPYLTCQMTLFAHARTHCAHQLAGVQNGTGDRALQMRGRIAMAALAGDRIGAKHARLIPVQRI